MGIRPAACSGVCALFTKEEVTALAKEAWRRHAPDTSIRDGVTSTTCWHGTQYGGWSIKITVERGRTAADMKEFRKGFTAMVGPSSTALKSVPGLGDAAFWQQGSPTNGQLCIVLGTDFVTVQTWGKAPGAGTLARTQELATLILQRFRERRGRSFDALE